MATKITTTIEADGDDDFAEASEAPAANDDEGFAEPIDDSVGTYSKEGREENQLHIKS